MWRYNCQDIFPCSPAKLASVRSIVLSGWTALTFNPATLSSTTQLAVLELTLQQPSTDFAVYRGFILPVNEIYQSYDMLSDPNIPHNQQVEAETGLETGGGATDGSMVLRPQWTWNWHLPHLTRLVLESEIAYLFQFRMLFGCPALKKLKLDIRSTVQSSHVRFISAADLVLSPPPISQSKDGLSSSFSSSSPSGKELCLPSLHTLDLNGAWVVNERVLKQLLMTTFPNLSLFTLQEWHFKTLKCLSHLIRTNAIFPKGSPSRRRRSRRVSPRISIIDNQDDVGDGDDGKEPDLFLGATKSTRTVLSRLGWTFGFSNCVTEDERREAEEVQNELGIKMMSCHGNNHIVQLFLLNPCSGDEDLRLFD